MCNLQTVTFVFVYLFTCNWIETFLCIILLLGEWLCIRPMKYISSFGLIIWQCLWLETKLLLVFRYLLYISENINIITGFGIKVILQNSLSPGQITSHQTCISDALSYHLWMYHWCLCVWLYHLPYALLSWMMSFFLFMGRNGISVLFSFDFCWVNWVLK